MSYSLRGKESSNREWKKRNHAQPKEIAKERGALSGSLLQWPSSERMKSCFHQPLNLVSRVQREVT
jgi:hypothetical protein